MHYQRIGKTETAEIIVNRSEHIIVEPLASGKHTEVNPMGFTIVVEKTAITPTTATTIFSKSIFRDSEIPFGCFSVPFSSFLFHFCLYFVFCATFQ